MTESDIKKTLEEHICWLNDEGGRRADLSEANLRRANLSGADLRRADLSEADLSEANLDFSVLPLWCGSLNVKVDDRIVRQLLYHVIRIAQVSSLSQELKDALLSKALIKQANLFHRATDGGVEKIEETLNASWET